MPSRFFVSLLRLILVRYSYAFEGFMYWFLFFDSLLQLSYASTDDASISFRLLSPSCGPDGNREFPDDGLSHHLFRCCYPQKSGCPSLRPAQAHSMIGTGNVHPHELGVIILLASLNRNVSSPPGSSDVINDVEVTRADRGRIVLTCSSLVCSSVSALYACTGLYPRGLGLPAHGSSTEGARTSGLLFLSQQVLTSILSSFFQALSSFGASDLPSPLFFRRSYRL